MKQIPNGGRLNPAFEELGIEYGARLSPDQPVSQKEKLTKPPRKRKDGAADAPTASPK